MSSTLSQDLPFSLEANETKAISNEELKKYKRTETKIKNRPTTGKRRIVYANLPLPQDKIDGKGRPNIKYVSNKIVTAKYTLWTFVPKNLFEQFRKVANLYFLFMAIIGLIPAISSNNIVLNLLPLTTVVFFTACKDAVEDRNRHQIDAQFNGATSYHLRNFLNVNYPIKPKLTLWKRFIIWRNIRVGDFLFLRNGDAVPADSIIISTSEPAGTCFVETKDLDGETNLKPRRCVIDTKNVRSAEDCAKLKFWVESEAPNSNLFTYNATLVIPDIPEEIDITLPTTPTIPVASKELKPKKTISIDINNLLLRAHVIRNTEWVIAITVYTGVETKIMLNSGETPSKRSRIEKEMNFEVILNFIILIILASICAIGSGISLNVLADKYGYNIVENIDSNRQSIELASFLTFWTGLIIFQNILPISLYISIEFVKGFQAFFIFNDLEMWDEETNSPCVPKSWNLSDDLGQIEYVFSDKTGTLTRNIMEFRQCSIDGKVYGNNGWGGVTDAEKGKMLAGNNIEKKKPSQDQIWAQYLEELKKTFDPKYSSTDKNFLTFVDPELFRDLRDEIDEINDKDFKIPNKSQLIKEFYTLLAVCHTVVVDESEPVTETTSSEAGITGEVIKGQSEPTSEINLASVDEEKKTELNSENQNTLNSAVQKVKNSLKEIVPSFIGIGSSSTSKSPLPVATAKDPKRIDKTVSRNLVYKAESPDEAALVSAAKNVGFVFLGRSNNSINVDVLGKEYVFELLNILEFNSTRKRMSVIARRPTELGGGIVLFCKGADNVIIERLASGQDQFVKATSQNIDEFSNNGLRTLTLAYRKLDETEYKLWAAKYDKASTAIVDRSKMIDAVSEEIENELILLGATAIEDKLQEGVPKSIASLREAGCKVWVLTGDKLETAINIGFAAQLLTKEMRLWIVRGTKGEEVRNQLDHIVALLTGKGDTKLEKGEEPIKPGEQHAFVVDGISLSFLLEDGPARQKIIDVSEFFHSVICCRVSPLQKALVVELIRRGKRSTTLAIGDGANDVSMIQAANVGVGISGQEGVQASMAADYSISQFKFLTRLLLVHGFWDYMRIAEMILNFFYKNVIWVFPVLWFSANIFYEYSFVQLYNMIFTVGSVIALGTTDQPVSASYCLRYPIIYSLGIKQKRYSRKLFIIYFMDGIWQSLVVYFTFFFIFYYSTNIVSSAGLDSISTEFSAAVAITVIVVANLIVSYNTYHWTWFIWAVLFGELSLIFLYVMIYGLFPEGPIYKVGEQLFSRGAFWFGMMFSIFLCGLPRYLVTFVKQWWFPDELDIEIEQWSQYKEFKDIIKIPSFPSPKKEPPKNDKFSNDTVSLIASAVSKMTKSTVVTYYDYLERDQKDPRIYEQLDFNSFYKTYLVGVRPQLQRLVFNGQELFNINNLGFYNITMGNFKFLKVCEWKEIRFNTPIRNFYVTNEDSSVNDDKGRVIVEILKNKRKRKWKISFHGVAKNHHNHSIADDGYLESEKYQKEYQKEYQKAHQFNNFSHGIYTTPNINLASLYAKTFTHDGIKFQILFQNLVDSETLVKVPISHHLKKAEYWVTPGEFDIILY
ncbi:5169_t:CDS:10, partial [Diversispora eburnea]